MKYKKVYEGEDGWSKWIQPNMEEYRMMCCECGLVHDLQFRAAVIEEDFGKYATFKHLDHSEYLVVFRARRNKRATAARRRRK